MNWGGIFLAPILWIFFSQVQQLPFFRVKLLLSGWRRCPAVPYRSSAPPPRRSRWRDAAEAGPRGRRNRPRRAVHPGGTATARQGPGLQRSEEGETGSQRSARSQASSRPREPDQQMHHDGHRKGTKHAGCGHRPKLFGIFPVLASTFVKASARNTAPA